MVDRGDITLDYDFLEGIVTYTDWIQTRSSSDFMSDRFLRVVTHLGMMLFYAISFTRYPRKAWRVFRNLFIAKRPETRLESALWRKLSKHDVLRETV